MFLCALFCILCSELCVLYFCCCDLLVVLLLRTYSFCAKFYKRFCFGFLRSFLLVRFILLLMMNLTILHNELNEFVEEKSGFSVLIEAGKKRVLFDVSYSDDIIKNALRGKVDLDGIDYLVLSHGHIDHTEGLKFIDFSNVGNLLAHPDCFEKKYFKGVGEIGCPMNLDSLKQATNVILSKKPYWIEEDNIVFLGEIPRKVDFEGNVPVGYLENGDDDFVLDDSAVVIKCRGGLIIVTGCSHSGICNIIEYAKEVCNENKVCVVIGGFHLFDKDVTDKTIEFIEGQGVDCLYPMHCLSKYAFSEFEKIGAKRIHALQEIVF